MSTPRTPAADAVLYVDRCGVICQDLELPDRVLDELPAGLADEMQQAFLTVLDFIGQPA